MTKAAPITPLQKYGSYALFIASVSVYFYWSKELGLNLFANDTSDPTIIAFIAGLALAWLGSVVVIAQRLRLYLSHLPGWRSYVTAITPLLIIPAVWGLLQGFKLFS